MRSCFTTRFMRRAKSADLCICGNISAAQSTEESHVDNPARVFAKRDPQRMCAAELGVGPDCKPERAAAAGFAADRTRSLRCAPDTCVGVRRGGASVGRAYSCDLGGCRGPLVSAIEPAVAVPASTDRRHDRLSNLVLIADDGRRCGIASRFAHSPPHARRVDRDSRRAATLPWRGAPRRQGPSPRLPTRSPHPA